MDYEKVKQNIIIILVFLNIILISILLYDRSNRNLYAYKEEYKDEAIRRVEDFGIKVNAEIKPQEKSVKPLIVKYEELDQDIINEKFFNKNGKISEGDGIVTIENGNEQITIINRRRMLYENFSDNKKLGSLKEIKEFLEEIGLDIDKSVLIRYEENDGLTTYEFTKTYKDRLIETSYTTLTLEDGHLRTIDRLWIEVLGEDNRRQVVEPPYKALYYLLNNDAHKGKTIDDVSFSYYFNPEEQGLLEDNTKAARGYAIPAWRIMFSTGETVLVDNY